MIASKRTTIIVVIAVLAALIFCALAIAYAPELIEKYGTNVTMEYETRIFDHSEPVVIDIRMDADQWDTMLNNATQEIYYACDVVIDGTKFYDVGIRPKGNTSLSSIASNPNTDRFSFKLEFDQFVDGQTAWGLDKLCLNNNYADATNMKEALFYDMYEFIGADASLYNYAEIYVNGDYWGIYLALEAVEDSFMLRNYGVTNGALYKPDTMGISRGEGDWGDRDDEGWGGSDGDRGEDDEGWGNSDGEGWGESEGRRQDGDSSPEPADDDSSDTVETSASTEAETDAAAPADDASDEAEKGENSASGEASREWRQGDDEGWGESDGDRGGGGFGGMFGSSGANLNYSGDDLDNYSTIWLSEVTTTGNADHKRVVEALKNISEGEDLEESMDIDNLLRLMAVHNFSVNSDSLSGSMAHNYYLYESSGRLNILPWDYNLAFGGMGFGGSSADNVANDPIDDSWGCTSFFDPLLENEEYLEKYHEYYRQLIEEYVFGGGFYEFYTRTRSQIDDLVATDPNALYNYDEYDAAAETLYALVVYRGESVLGQLDGTIPSTSAGQRQDSSTLIKAEDVDISLMGSMSMGGSFGGGGGWGERGDPFRRNRSSGEASDEASGEQTSGEQTEDASGEQTETQAGPDPGDPTSAASGEPAAAAEPEETAEAEESVKNEDASDEPDEDREASGEMKSSRRSGWSSASREMQQEENNKKLWLLGGCGAFLIIGIVVAAVFKKKR